MTKVIKRVKDYSYKERLKKLVLTTLLERRMWSDLIETSKIIYGISNYGRHFFSIFLQTEYLPARKILKSKSFN